MAASCTLTSSSPLAVSSSNSPRGLRFRRFGVVAMASVGQKVYVPGVAVSEGNGGLPKIDLKSPHGSGAEIYLFGACVTSFKVPSGKDLLFVRPDAVFNGQKPISGGIPHCFPQFGPGPMQQHGFARNMNWSITDSEVTEGDPAVTLELKDDPYSRSMWDFSFKALYKVVLHSKSLSTTLEITNTDDKPFSFNSALHSYFRASISGVSVKGLKGCKTLNKDPDPKNPLEGTEDSYFLVEDAERKVNYLHMLLNHFIQYREEVNFPGFVDCIYLSAPSELTLDNGLGDKIAISNANWSDAVLWNPHLQMEACYKDFVCVENAKIETVQLEPKQSWVAEQKIGLI